MQNICLDTGFLSIYYDEKSLDKQRVMNLMGKIKSGEIIAHVLKPVLSELFYHICLIHGKDFASSRIVTLINTYPLRQISLDIDLILTTGQIKCQDRKNLSYIDCMSIAYCLIEKIPFHTTEKLIKNIPTPTLNKLKVVTYRWS